MFDLKQIGRRKLSGGNIYLCTSGLIDEQIDAWRTFIASINFSTKKIWQLVEFSEAAISPRKDQAFAVLSSSESLSRKIISNFDEIFIFPLDKPKKIDPWLLWKFEQANLVIDQLSISEHAISLISSVFNADKFLFGFLENSSALIGYQDYEHFLITPNSPGNEHEALLEHVKKWPLAIYIHLPEDPGLYEVWNLGARLATGHYLSNANLDDRRSPEHLVYLKHILDSKPRIAAAAAALKVTSSENLAWSQAADCSTMFTDIPAGEYGFDDLFRRLKGQWASRNFLHCMPLWRRDLHLRYGWFNEKQFGPSADWEFWLRCGQGGSTFYFMPEPQGVYLKIESSYWRREPKNKIFDEKIIFGYKTSSISDALNLPIKKLYTPLAVELIHVSTLFNSGYSLEAIAQLIRIYSELQGEADNSLAVINNISKFHLNIEAEEWLPLVITSLGVEEAAVDLLVYALALILHNIPEKSDNFKNKNLNNLETACFEVVYYGNFFAGKFLLAFLQKFLNNKEKEKTIINYLFEKNEKIFWRDIQKIYLFDTSSKVIYEELLHRKPINTTIESKKQNINLAYFPAFSGNSYLDLLYAPYRQPSNIVSGYLDFSKFIQHEYNRKKNNVLHIHWINSIWSDKYLVDEKEKSVIQSLSAAKKNGFELYWTIHNYVSHESDNISAEIEFRKKLYALVDKVFVHHPLAINKLDWLPDHEKIHIFEHGAYPLEVNTLSCEDITSLEKFINLQQDQLLISVIGQVRAYKGLENILPTILNLTEKKPSIKFLIAGKIKDPIFHDILKKHHSANIKIIDEHLPLSKLNHIMKMSDFGLLSYDKILTSGTLFHWLSAGKPVLAPSKGTIPAYVVNAWNGFIYDSAEHLSQLLINIEKLNKKHIQLMGKNSLKIIPSLKWENFDK